MSEEERIFGPFTLKQFITLAAAFGLAYAANLFLPEPLSYGATVVIVLAALFVTFVRLAPKVIPPEELRQYFLEQRASLPPEEYRKLLQRKVIYVFNQIEMRERAGLPPDPKLEEVKQVFESLRR